MKERIVKPDYVRNFSLAKDFNLWGKGRMAHNIDRSAVAHLREFEMAEQGVTSYIDDYLTRAKADVGDAMILIEGVPRSADGALGAPAPARRFCTFITGTIANHTLSPMQC